MTRRLRILGVDLAWGPRGLTGLAAVGDGRVLDSTAVRKDREIEAWVRARSGEDTLLAIDAPLVVPAGPAARGCDRVLASVYGPAHAGPHPVNRGMRHFTRGGRAMGLVRRLGFGFDPEAIGRRPLRLALEVYPHPALVSLFALPRTLKYKAKRGRTLAGRRREFERLVTALRRLADFAPRLRVTSGPGWERLEESVHRADSGAALDRVEDELDAHLCAYVGLYHLRWRGVRSMTVGDARGGYVVTPVDPGRTAALRAKAQELGVTIA